MHKLVVALGALCAVGASATDPFADGLPASVASEASAPFQEAYGYYPQAGYYPVAQQQQQMEAMEMAALAQGEAVGAMQPPPGAYAPATSSSSSSSSSSSKDSADIAALQTSLATSKGKYEPEGADPSVSADPYSMSSSTGISGGGYYAAGNLMHDPYAPQYTPGSVPSGAPDAYKGMVNAHLGHTGAYCDSRISLHCGFQPKLRGAAPKRYDMATSDLRTTTGPFAPSQPEEALNAANAAFNGRYGGHPSHNAYIGGPGPLSAVAPGGMGDPLRGPTEHVPLPDYIQSSRSWSPGANAFTTADGPTGFEGNRNTPPPQTAVDPTAPGGDAEAPSERPMRSSGGAPGRRSSRKAKGKAKGKARK